MVDKDWPRRLNNHLIFLRLTVIELRRLAARKPESAIYLQHMADQLEAEITEVAGCPDELPRGFV
jgi:hypothetical protein